MACNVTYGLLLEPLDTALRSGGLTADEYRGYVDDVDAQLRTPLSEAEDAEDAERAEREVKRLQVQRMFGLLSG